MTNFAEKSNFISNLSNFLSGNDKDLLQALELFIQNYKQQKKMAQIPVRLFSGKLAASEVIVKYLKESGLSYAEISRIINRDQRTVWVTYSKAIKKQKEAFTIKNDDLLVDIALFSTKDKPLRTLIKHLIQNGYSTKQVAKMLNRSYKNIWMIAHG